MSGSTELDEEIMLCLFPCYLVVVVVVLVLVVVLYVRRRSSTSIYVAGF